MQCIVIQLLLAERARTFAKSRVIQHPYLIPLAGKIRRIWGIPPDITLVSMEIQDHPLNRGIGSLEFYDVQVRCFVIGEIDLRIGLPEIIFYAAVYGLRMQ